MSYILWRANDALNVNPPAGDQQLSVNGSSWLWAVTALFAVSLLAFVALTFVTRTGEKVFHYLFAITLFVGTITYFANASDLGWSVVGTTNETFNGATRQIFWAKYVFWVVAFPAVTIALGLLSGVSWATIVYNVFLAWIWIIAYLVGAYTETNYKWGFFAFGTVAWALLTFSTLAQGTSAARRVGAAIRDHSILSGWVAFLWFLYPIAWGLSDGGNRIGVTGSFIFFGILDLLLIPVTGLVFLFLSRRWDYNRLNLAFTQYGRVNTAQGTFPEKHTGPTAGHAGGVTGAPHHGGVAGGVPGDQAV